MAETRPRPTACEVHPDKFMTMDRPGSFDLNIIVGGFKSAEEARAFYTAVHEQLMKADV